MPSLDRKKILIVDDNPSIHKDFQKIFRKEETNDLLDENEAILFDKQSGSETVQSSFDYEVNSAFQGEEAFAMVQKAAESHKPYSLAFVDMIMPPGWNGITTIRKLWEVDPHIQIVICSAHSEYSWEDISRELGITDNLLFLKKPFEVIEISQFCSSLTKKWELRKQVQFQIENLQSIVKERTIDLEKSFSLVEATLESTEEGIIVLNLDKTIVKHNQKFMKTWKLTDNIRNLDPYLFFQKLATLVEDPTFFLKIMMNLGNVTETEPLKKIVLKTGEILEFYVTPQMLDNRIVGTVCSFRDITERIRLEEKLLHQATHDSLTQLPNRILLNDRIQQAIIHAKRYDLLVGIVLFDLDFFKQINDTYGHEAGDLLLITVAKRIKSLLREEDTLARLGGDEFVIVLPSQASRENFAPMVEKIINSFTAPFIINDHKITCSASIGISIYPHDGQQIEKLLKSSDIALYHSKELGRGKFYFYQEDFDIEFSQKALLSSDLHHALKNKEIILYYQPLINLATSQIVGLEALFRWQHPVLGEILPIDFMPLAEKIGLINSIEEWVFQTACEQVKEWQGNGSANLHLAIDVSSHQFRQKNFVAFVSRVIEETGFDANCLDLNLAESMIVGNYGEFSDKMLELKELGVHLSINNFGTGYSNLNHLKYFPFDKIKIDKSFIGDVSDSNNNSIVDIIIRLSKKMDMAVLAEGVENPEQIQYLRNHLGDQVQGYYYRAPLDHQACDAMLKQGFSPMVQ